MTGVVGGVRGQFGGRQSEDQPAVAGIDGRELQYVVEECTNRVCVLGEDDRVVIMLSRRIVARPDPGPAQMSGLRMIFTFSCDIAYSRSPAASRASRW